jgi:hypothetical protein
VDLAEGEIYQPALRAGWHLPAGRQVKSQHQDFL